MSTRTLALVIVAAAAAVVGIMWWQRRTATPAPPPPQPGPPSPSGDVATAFSNMLSAGTNWVANWFVDRVGTTAQAGVSHKPPPITEKSTTAANPAATTVGVVTSPTYVV
jgi:hypothetical protein